MTRSKLANKIKVGVGEYHSVHRGCCCRENTTHRWNFDPKTEFGYGERCRVEAQWLEWMRDGFEQP